MDLQSAFFAVLSILVGGVGLVAVFLARRRERAAVLAAERAARMKNDFVSMVSHELRTPLTSISGFGSLLAEGWQDLGVEEVNEFLNIVVSQAKHLEELVEDVLVIPRLEAGRLRLEPELLDISVLAHELAALTFRDSDAEAQTTIPGGAMVFADRRRVGQVLRNLLENARKYGGDQVLIEGAHVGELFMVVVSDNGQGVKENEREIIFRHFEQVSKGDSRANQGIGLGLPIARNLARAMGGDVWYEPRFPVGARFCFTLRTTSADERVAMPARV